jgi:hypothetical protein
MNVLEVLKDYGFDPQQSGEGELKVCCPFHGDKSPSCFVNIERQVFICHTAGCEAKGSLASLVARKSGSTPTKISDVFRTKYGFDPSEKIVKAHVVEKWHVALRSELAFKEQLHARGVTDTLIAKYRIGAKDDRITIPIKSATGNYVNIRLYKPGASGADKFRNQKGRGQTRLYPIEQCEYPSVVLCGGELKAIVAADQLNRHNIGAITLTSGEENYDPILLQKLAGKRVYICFDIDDAGRRGAYLCGRILSTIADWVGVLNLPLDPSKYPKGDINDYIGSEKKDVFPLLEAVPEWQLEVVKSASEKSYKAVLLSEAMHADNTMRRVKVKALVTAVDKTPYAIPSQIGVDCSRDIKACIACPIYTADPSVAHPVPTESPIVLGMINANKKMMRECMMEALQIPLNCNKCKLTPVEFYNVEDARITPQLEVTTLESNSALQPAICIGTGIDANETYEFQGRMVPNPNTQQATLLMSTYKTTDDALSSYKPKDLSRLEIFQPTDWAVESIRSKLNDIYHEFEQNVTGIFNRRLLHLVVDLTYHSALFIPFDGKTIKGWVETLIVGDSSNGKSETAIGLQAYYGLGQKVDCKNATLAGLLGGLQSLNNRWFVTWGVMPTQDRRMVILEEMKGLAYEIIGRLTDMRSSGIAELPKIERRRTHARTRICGISNPRDDKTISQYSFGIEAIKHLIGNLEDIRRFDMCHIVAADDIDPKILSDKTASRRRIPSVYTSELSRELILYTWTREVTQIKFEDEEHIRSQAVMLCEKYTEAIPIVDRGSMRLKLARLATALACRTFSVSEDRNNVIVRKAHVEVVISALTHSYDADSFGYDAYSKALRISNTISKPGVVKTYIANTPYPADLVKQFLHASDITLQDIQDWCGQDREIAQSTLGWFVRHHCIKRDKRVYRKTPTFIEMLKELASKGNLPEETGASEF